MQQRDSIVCGRVYHLLQAEKRQDGYNIGGSDQNRRDMLLTVRTTAVEPVSPGE